MINPTFLRLRYLAQNIFAIASWICFAGSIGLTVATWFGLWFAITPTIVALIGFGCYLLANLLTIGL